MTYNIRPNQMNKCIKQTYETLGVTLALPRLSLETVTFRDQLS